MDSVFKKMNFKDQTEICVLQAPDSFAPNLDNMRAITAVKTELEGLEKLQFGLAFVTKQSEVDAFSVAFAAKLDGDGQIWFAYPKGASKRYKCEFNRDNGWAILGKLGFEPVRMVAIDEDWSALRLRKVEYIKNMTRSTALTDAGKTRIGK